MTNHGDDCYFFYYSTCTKGDSCPFRHCEAAMGNETVCNLWQEGRCFRTVCKFRHMEITKNRKEIHCYWETQPAGCQKPHCAFFHEKARYIDGVFVPPNKGGTKTEEQLHEEPAPLPAAPLPTAANPQLRGVKTEAQEPVPSPTHPPVVINPADDDEDEDDQFSEEGEDSKGGPSPRKLPKSGDSLNFGVSTLEEIRLRKALKASMKRAGYPIQSADTQTNGEKENIQSLFSPALHQAREDPVAFDESWRPRGGVADRLGKRIPNNDRGAGDAPLKRSLAQRLGGVVDEIKPLMPPQKSLKSIQERLGFSGDSVAPSSPEAEGNVESKKAPEEIRIKTLEEIRQERAARSQSSKQKDDPLETKTKTTKGVKQTIAVKHNSIGRVKAFSEILHDKKKGQAENEEQQEQKPSPKAAKRTLEKAPGKSQGDSDAAEPGPEAGDGGRVRVKTLEEIRREKAARIQAQQAQQAPEAEEKKSSNSEENSVKKRRLLCIKKPAQTGSQSTEKSCEETEKPLKGVAAPPETNGSSVTVKSFEEIMREKRSRKQEMEEQAKVSAGEEPPQKQPVKATLKRTVPTKISLTSPDSSSSSSSTPAPDTTLPAQKTPVRKRILLKPKAASPVSSTTGSIGAASSSGPVSQSSPPPPPPPPEAEPESCLQGRGSSRVVPGKNTNGSITLSPAKQARAAPQGAAAEAMAADTSRNKTQKKSPEHSTDTKVRPKLNVKPSVVKPAVQVKPGLKRRGGERSAVAAVKPLNSSSPVLDESLQDITCRQMVPPTSNAEAQMSSAVPCSPSTTLDFGSSSSPLREDLQTVPVFKQSQSQETKPTVSVAAARDACTVPQSPVLKTPAQPKSRRQSAAASRPASTSSAAVSTSAVDDFEDLINEFTDDHLEEDMDPDLGEDDLLQELSEMIDS